MLIFASTIHVLLCVFMIFVILLQPGKDAGMGSALGGGAATSAFGGRGAVTFLGKVTAICAIGFFITSLGLSFVGMKSSLASKLASEAAAPTTTTLKKDDTKKEEPKKEPAGLQEAAPSVPAPTAPAPTPNEAAPGPK